MSGRRQQGGAASRLGWSVAKWLLFAVVSVFLGRRAWQLWQQGGLSGARLQPWWLVPAAAAYAVGWLPSVWFWRRMMTLLGTKPRWKSAVAGYYVGHLGKYVPGKAMVLVLRAGVARADGVPLAVGALTATYETLFLMAVALAVGVALSPLFLQPDQWALLPTWLSWLPEHAAWVPVAVLLATACALPVVARLFSWVARKMTPAELAAEARADVGHIPTGTLLAGLVAFCVAWALHGLSLGFTLRSLGVRLSWAAWPVWTAAVALATSVGFLAVFAPGGLGVREGLLIETLRGAVGGPTAVLAAVLLRAVWFATELVVAGVLYVALLSGSSRTSEDERPASDERLDSSSGSTSVDVGSGSTADDGQQATPVRSKNTAHPD